MLQVWLHVLVVAMEMNICSAGGPFGATLSMNTTASFEIFCNLSYNYLCEAASCGWELKYSLLPN